MNTLTWIAWTGLAAAVLISAGCRRGHAPDDHAGHDHAGHSHPAPKHTTAPAEGGALMCGEHGVPEAQCAICRPEAAAQLQAGEGLKVRLPSTNSTALVGVATARPTTGEAVEAVDCMAEIVFNQNKLARITAPVGGIIQSVDADWGAQVAEGQTVAALWSAVIAEAVARAVLSHQTLDRERKLRAQRVTAEKDLQEAEAAHRAACQQLRTLGFTEAQIDELEQQPQARVLLPLTAPFAGEIIERQAVQGELVEPGKTLFTVADRGTMWAMLQVPEAALGRLRLGQPVEVRLEALPERVFPGKLTWISPAVDERTRLVRARAEVPNPDGLLRDKVFARARILTRRTEGALWVPGAAVQYLEGKPLVFVKLEEDLFEARAVSLGGAAHGRQEIAAGLRADEAIAVTRAFALKSAMLMSRLGAGCADD